MDLRLSAALLSLLLLAGLALPAAARSSWEAGGYLKSLNLRLGEPPRSALPGGELSSNRLRLDLTGRWAGGLGAEFSVENLLLYRDPPGVVPFPRVPVNRAVDLEKDWNSDGRFSDRLAVDRLNLRGRLAGVEWTAGRQAIGYGRIALFSPLDVIAPFAPDALDTDVRPGVDALRLVRYFGLGGQLGGAAVFGGESGHDSLLANFSVNLKGWDLLLLGGSLREREMAGGGLAGSVAGVGVKAEGVLYDGREPGEQGGDLHDSFAIAGLELWYRLANDLVLIAEYLYNGAGVEDPEDYPRAAASAPFREGLSFLLGRHYLLAGPSYPAHPLVDLQATLIWNLEDDSFFLRPLVDLSLSDNLVLQLFWSFTAGREPERIFGLPLPRSEFGSAGQSGGFYLKYFF